jgi:hypothetical protein
MAVTSANKNYGFKVLIMVTVKITVICDVTLLNPVDRYKSFGEA